MMAKQSSAKNNINPKTLTEAATWYVDLSEEDTSTELQTLHQQWLAQNASHRLAWARVEKLHNNMKVLPNSINSSTILSAQMSRRQAIKALSVVLGASGTIWHQQDNIKTLTAQHKTATGENLNLTLSDGTQVQLNTNSAIDVRYNNLQRALYLHHGEIQIITGDDTQQREFFVFTPQGNVQALGTKFLLRSENNFCQVKVIEDSVIIQSRYGNNEKLTLTTKQQSHFTESSIGKIEKVDEYANAWTQGLLIVQDWSLGKFIKELSRYHKGKLSCTDSAAKLRISGSFHLKDTVNILENLSNTLPINLRSFSRYWLRIEAK